MMMIMMMVLNSFFFLGRLTLHNRMMMLTINPPPHISDYHYAALNITVHLRCPIFLYSYTIITEHSEIVLTVLILSHCGDTKCLLLEMTNAG
jgi:hypothetical protein